MSVCREEGGLLPIAFPVPVPSADGRTSCLRLGVDVALALRLYFLSFIVSASSLFLCLKIKHFFLPDVRRLNR